MPGPSESLSMPCPAEAGRSRRRNLWPLGFLLVAGLVWLWLVDPEQSSLYPTCVFHALTGLHCPGCGATRAAHALLHGRLGQALDFHPLVVLGLPALGLIFAWRRWRLGSWSLPAISGQVVLAALLVFGLARNLPGPISSLLAPPEPGAVEEDQDADADEEWPVDSRFN
jgi:hypothetical protein